MSRDRICLAAALLLALAVLPGWAFAGEPAQTTTYEVRGTTIQWNHSARATGTSVRPQLADELRALVRARLQGEPVPVTRAAAQEKLADGSHRARVPVEKLNVILFQFDPHPGPRGAEWRDAPRPRRADLQ